MSLILSSILLFVLFAPGITFRLGYLANKTYQRTVIDDITWSILPALVLQYTGFLVVSKLTQYEIKLDYVFYILTAITDIHLISEVSSNIKNNAGSIFLYNLILTGAGATFGHFLRKLVRYSKFDRRYKALRFYNSWHYVLSGECLDFPNVPDKYEEISVKIVDILCDLSGEHYIYIGELFDYYLDDKGELKEIHLRYPMRRKLQDDDSSKEDRYYEIPSRFIIIPYKNIININIRYFNFTEKGRQ